jgi:hypothetical protein
LFFPEVGALPPDPLPRLEFGRSDLVAREIPFMQAHELGLCDVGEALLVRAT